MSVKALVLCSAATMFGAQSATAQITDTTAPSTTATPQAGANPGDTSTTPGSATVRPNEVAAADAAEDTIVVTGLRRSLQSAQAIKRNADIIVDSIVAEDIGKLPDTTVSDTAARIVGVQVERGGGEASRVLVRGLPDFTTTYNGREIFTAESRSVALQDFPAGAIAALEVFKTTTANTVEGGLAGEVNVRSRKPFDFDGFQIAGSGWAQYSKRADVVTPNGNVLLTDRWDTGIGEIGALVNFSYQQLTYLDSNRSNTDFVANPGIGPGGQQLLFPDIQRVTYGQGQRTRPSINGALQWRPMDGLELYAEGLWQGFRNKVQDRELSIPLYGVDVNDPINVPFGVPTTYSNIVLQPGTTNVVQSLTAINPRRPEGFQGATYAKTDTFQYAFGGKYDAGPLNLNFDIARTRSKFNDSVYSLDTAFATRTTVNANTGAGATGPSFILGNGGVNVLDPSTYIYRGFFDRQLIAKGDDWQARLDAVYDTGFDWLPKIDVGVRYVDRDAHFEDGNRYNYREPDRLPLSALPIETHVGASGFPSSDPSSIQGYLTPTYDSIRSNIDQLRAFSGFAPGAPPPDLLGVFSANEKSYAGYGQVHYAFGSPDGIRVDGVLGVRGVKTKLSIDGNQAVGGVVSPIATSKSYTDWLPNASARIRFTNEIQMRLSYTRTRSRPTFAQYNPGQTVDPPVTCGEQNTTNCIRNASGGNPNLNPLKSKNYDLSLEYYFSRSGSASVAVFRRDLNGFIQNYQTFVTDPTFGLVRVNRPFNTGQGRIDGAEAQVTTFLDIDSLPAWVKGFGVSANVTYLDAKTGFPALFGDPVAGQSPIVGVSKWTYNADAFYEGGGLSTRVSYNRRSGFPSSSGYTNPDRTYTERTKPISRLDFSGSYDLFKNLTLTADWTNILAKPLRIDETTVFASGQSVTLPRIIRYEESIISAGFRFRF